MNYDVIKYYVINHNIIKDYIIFYLMIFYNSLLNIHLPLFFFFIIREFVNEWVGWVLRHAPKPCITQS